MRMKQLAVEWEMTTRKLARNRFALVLLLVIPALFYAIMMLTNRDTPIPIELASGAGEGSEPLVLEVSQRDESLVFVGLASVGLLTSFLALNVVQKNGGVNQRLVLCGYRPAEMVTAKLLAVSCVVAVVGVYTGGILRFLFVPQRYGMVMLGFILGAFVYGCDGLLVGVLFRRELVGILFIVLLANIDVGWLQNPASYASSTNQWIIRVLPGHLPSQVSMLGAFTDREAKWPILGSLAYGAGLLVLAILAFSLRTRVRR
jgi:hypothetical protein